MSPDDSAQAKLDKVDTLLALTSTSELDAALFAEMLSLPNDGRYPAIELTPEQRRKRTLEALGFPVGSADREKSGADDLRGCTLDRSYELGSVRSDYRPGSQPSCTADRDVPARVSSAVDRTTITSPQSPSTGLGSATSRPMIDRVVGNKLIPAGVRQDIIERTDGIPLFVEEMTKSVLEAGTEDEAQRTAAAIPSPALAVPASLHASLMARLDRLGPAKEVAQIGAAIGREFSHALLSAVVSKPEQELALALDRLIAAGLLFRQGVPPHASYLFKHALVQDAAYGTLLRGRRQQLHARIAATLEGHFSEIVETQPEVLARHCAEAGLAEKAVGYWLKAGQQAMKSSAMLEAEAATEQGLGSPRQSARRHRAPAA